MQTSLNPALYVQVFSEVQNAFKNAGLTTTVDSKTGNCKAVAGYTVVKNNTDGITLPTNDGVKITCTLLHDSQKVTKTWRLVSKN